MTNSPFNSPAEQMIFEFYACTNMEEQGLWAEKWIAPYLYLLEEATAPPLSEAKKKELQKFMKKRVK